MENFLKNGSSRGKKSSSFHDGILYLVYGQISLIPFPTGDFWKMERKDSSSIRQSQLKGTNKKAILILTRDTRTFIIKSKVWVLSILEASNSLTSFQTTKYLEQLPKLVWYAVLTCIKISTYALFLSSFCTNSWLEMSLNMCFTYVPIRKGDPLSSLIQCYVFQFGTGGLEVQIYI